MLNSSNDLNTIEISELKKGEKDFEIKINNTKKSILAEVSKLNKLEHIEIFKILSRNNVEYTENVNGIFVNMKNLDLITLNNIIKFINYAKNKNIELLEKESMLSKTKKQIYGYSSDSDINNLESKIQILKDNLKLNLETLKK
jgi:hypothetical protein